MEKREVKEWIGIILLAIFLVVIIRTFILDNRIVPTPSMVPTIQPGDRLFVEKITHRFKELERGEVIVFVSPEQSNMKEDFIKRLIGLPGDIIEIKDSTLFVNGEPLDEPYLAEPMQYSLTERKVPEGKFFALGDNRNRSYDSHEWGFAEITSIKGKALYTYWPISRRKYWK
ncbi:MAG: signal peptidase I [Clostridia bacterium]|nr:signal peptidase I [Clostridia bacterium]MDD4047493.1 signal peptidase I [Clostridia bacterium]